MLHPSRLQVQVSADIFSSSDILRPPSPLAIFSIETVTIVGSSLRKTQVTNSSLSLHSLHTKYCIANQNHNSVSNSLAVESEDSAVKMNFFLIFLPDFQLIVGRHRKNIHSINVQTNKNDKHFLFSILPDD